MMLEGSPRLAEENRTLRAENAAQRVELAALRQEVQMVRGQLEQALQQIAELEQRQSKKPPDIKPNRGESGEPKAPRKKRAQEHNTSRKRSEPTRYERHALERCPECDYRLSGESVDYTREVVELPPPPAVEVTEHQVIKRWCPHCRKWRSPQLDLSGQVIGHGRIGVRIASLVAHLRTELRMPVRAIQALLETLHGLQLSTGEIVALTHQVRRELEPAVKELKASFENSPIVHGDETGWRENGQNGFIWGFATPGPDGSQYFEFARSRGHAIPRGILGSAFRGYLVSDFYAAYNLLSCGHQRCWVHLLRDLHGLKEAHAENEEVMAWAKAVRKVYDQAQKWLEQYPQATNKARDRAYRQAFEWLGDLGRQYALTYEHPCCTLAKRVLRHQGELFQFVRVPGLAADNNLIERRLRPLVIARKISGGTRSEEGTRTRLALFSLMQTWTARGLNPFHQCLALLQRPTANAPP